MAFQNCTASIKTAATPKQTIKIFLVVSDIVFTPRAKNHIPPAQNCRGLVVHHKAMNLDQSLNVTVAAAQLLFGRLDALAQNSAATLMANG